MAPNPEDLVALVVPYLERQPWFVAEMETRRAPAGNAGSTTGDDVPRLVDLEVLLEGCPGMASLVVGVGGRPFHVLVGWREPAVAPAILGAQQGAVLGICDDAGSDVVAYDALCDEELALVLLGVASRGTERADRCRVVQSLVSHASLVYDERLFMKSYRVLEPAPRPEVELLSELDRVGFNHLLGPVACWSRAGFDLALVREFLAGAVEGRALALTSLRDLFGRVALGSSTPDDLGVSGGDLGSEMRRLGETTGRLHLALALAFGTRPLEPGIADVRGGVAIRVHGDYHLRRVMRTDQGWVVAGFGDDPIIGSVPGARFASPLEDVADLWFSLRQVAAEAVAARPPGTKDQAQALARAWEQRNKAALVAGYLATAGITELVPGSVAQIEDELGRLVAGRSALPVPLVR